MQVAEPLVAPWKASLSLGFTLQGGRTVLTGRAADGPLAVQKPLYPEGDAVCQVIVVHPPGGIAGGDELTLGVRADKGCVAQLTTPGAGKWYRSAGPQARQSLAFEVEGTLEWLPRESIVFEGADAVLDCRVELGASATYIGWEVVCLGRRGFAKGRLALDTRLRREGRLLFVERGVVEAGSRLLASPAGLGGHSVFGAMLCAAPEMNLQREEMPAGFALTRLPGVLVARYLGDSSEEALSGFTALWQRLRPTVLGRDAVPPRIWST